MREILFRGKDNGVLNNQWQLGSADCTNEEFPQIIRYDRFGNKMYISVDKETLGQFTGLTDKNGKKIFEGDILSTENGTFSNTGMGHILFYKGMWTSFYGQDALGRDCFDELHTVCNSREVIGNIHDNPELLEG